MIINNAPSNEAVLSNVGEIGEFRIRNSAKAFNILSSGLYANKIRAIIRELSCNAVDSHTAAGKQNTPFDVHLPTQLEPTFSVRDYGTGLSHDQVINIYTTYFESTKTESNQFIGALGLGSKSPFSYTDNFTVTAIKDGQRGVYSAFINGEGVPSIALMHSEETTEPNGVEIQFAVDNRNDFYKFEEEAQYVYTYFKLRPVVSSGSNFEFREVEYEDKNIIPGVHVLKQDRYSRSSRAIMGNIRYPIEIPNSQSALGELAELLNCGLEIHFEIGEVDFQASREGLSYIPQTIKAIKTKLEQLNAQLVVHLGMEADTITNKWEKALFLAGKSGHALWREAVKSYVATNKFDLVNTDHGYVRTQNIKLKQARLLKNCNIQISAFEKNNNSQTCSDIRVDREHVPGTDKTKLIEYWSISVAPHTVFIENDLKTGAITRAKYHWRMAATKGVALPNSGTGTGRNHNYYHVYVLSPVDKTKKMNLSKFYEMLSEPPEVQRLKASELLEKERAERTKSNGETVSILRLEEKDYGRRDQIVWSNAGTASEYDSKLTYYYVPLSGYSPVNPELDPKDVYECMLASGIPELTNMKVYGVRKGDIEYIKSLKNWVELETYLPTFLTTLSPKNLSGMVTSSFDGSSRFSYNAKIANAIENAASPYLVLTTKFKNKSENSFDRYRLNRLLSKYAPGVGVDAMIETLKAEIASVNSRYPLMCELRGYYINEEAVAEYINLIDKSKGC